MLLLGGWPIYKGTEFVTDGYVFQDSKIGEEIILRDERRTPFRKLFLLTRTFIFSAFGPCPSCGAENRVYFGDILGVKGFDDVAGVKCDNCKIQFKVQRDTLRASTVPKAN